MADLGNRGVSGHSKGCKQWLAGLNGAAYELVEDGISSRDPVGGEIVGRIRVAPVEYVIHGSMEMFGEARIAALGSSVWVGGRKAFSTLTFSDIKGAIGLLDSNNFTRCGQ